MVDLRGQNTPESGYEILQFFDYEHLPAHLQEVSRPFHDLAYDVAQNMGLPRCAETSTALRKLLEAKDAAVRAKVQGWPAEQGMKGGNESIPTSGMATPSPDDSRQGPSLGPGGVG